MLITLVEFCHTCPSVQAGIRRLTKFIKKKSVYLNQHVFWTLLQNWHYFLLFTTYYLLLITYYLLLTTYYLLLITYYLLLITYYLLLLLTTYYLLLINYYLLLTTFFLLSITSLHVVKTIPSSCIAFFNSGSIMASISPRRIGPESEI